MKVKSRRRSSSVFWLCLSCLNPGLKYFAFWWFYLIECLLKFSLWVPFSPSSCTCLFMWVTAAHLLCMENSMSYLFTFQVVCSCSFLPLSSQIGLRRFTAALLTVIKSTLCFILVSQYFLPSLDYSPNKYWIFEADTNIDIWERNLIIIGTWSIF